MPRSLPSYRLCDPEWEAALDAIGYEAHDGPGEHISARADLLQRCMRGVAEFGEAYANLTLEGFECPAGFEYGREFEHALRLAKWELTGRHELSAERPGMPPLSRAADRDLADDIEAARAGLVPWRFALEGDRLERAQALALVTHAEVDAALEPLEEAVGDGGAV